MEVLERFRNKVIALDTAPFIYFFEEHPAYLPFLKLLFEANKSGELLFITSVITLTEVLVFPFREKRFDLVEVYTNALQASKGINIVAVRADVALKAAQLRADWSFRTPDALQLATAITSHADFFLTNDKALTTLPDIEVLLLQDYV